MKIELYLKQIMSLSKVASILSGKEGLTSLSHPLGPSTFCSVPIILRNFVIFISVRDRLAIPEFRFRNCIRKLGNFEPELDLGLSVFLIADKLLLLTDLSLINLILHLNGQTSE